MYYFLASKIAHKNSGVIQEIIRYVHSVEEKKLNFVGLKPLGHKEKPLCPF